jgi:RimJ/RimL family protein N-acetyltransferase
MKQLMLDHAFRFVECVVFRVAPENYRSQRAVEKIGGVRTRSRTDVTGRISVLFELRTPQHRPSVR